MFDGHGGRSARTIPADPDELASGGRSAQYLNPPRSRDLCGFEPRPGHRFRWCNASRVVACDVTRGGSRATCMSQNVTPPAHSAVHGDGVGHAEPTRRRVRRQWPRVLRAPVGARAPQDQGIATLFSPDGRDPQSTTGNERSRGAEVASKESDPSLLYRSTHMPSSASIE